MSRSGSFFLGMLLLTAGACNSPSAREPEKTATESIRSTPLPPSDTTVIIRFSGMNVAISRLVVFDDKNELKQVQNDSVHLSAELGEIIEGQLLSVSGPDLQKITVEQSYETSMSISGEGEHCDLLNWKHFRSEWTQLEQNAQGRFVLREYSPAQCQRFPEVELPELKAAVLRECGPEWEKKVTSLTTATAAPVLINISRYYIRITTGGGQPRQKLIIIEVPLGC